MQSWRVRLFAYLSATWRYRWYGLAAAWAFCLVGWLGVALIPNTYESVAKVYIDTHTMLRPLLKGLAVTTDPDQQIKVMLQTLLTDPNVESVVRATNPKSASMSQAQMQDAVAKLRNNVTLQNLPAKNLYSITYSDRDSGYAQSVAQTLVSVLIDSSLGGQRRDADQAGSFLDNQIANYEQKLEAADKRRADFKAAHLDFFTSGAGGDRVAGTSDIVAAKAALTQAENALNDAVNRRNALRAQLGKTSQTLNVDSPLPPVMDGGSTAIGHRTQLAAAIAKLNMLRTQYTDNYPDVLAQKRLIDQLQKQQAGNSSDTQGISNPSYVMLMSKLADADSEMVVDRSRLGDAQKRLEDAKRIAQQAITVQREYEDLDRDYQVLHNNYEALVSRRESAKITQAAGDQQSAFVFRVLSPPLKPDRPSAPNRLLLNAAVLFLGIGGGAGLAFFLGQFSGTFVSIEQLRDAFELPVLGSVTMVRTGADTIAAVRSTTFFAAGLGLLVASYLIVLMFFHTVVANAMGPLL